MEIPWPRNGDRLFLSGGLRSLAGCVIADISLTAIGYKEAADILVESLVGGRNDALVLPILFCYRQYLELQLKALTQAGGALFGEDFRRTHDLGILWKPLKTRILSEIIDGEEREVLAVVEECILEMNVVDQHAQAFRYPEFEAMQAINHQVDLGNLKAVMNRLAEFLGALESQWESSV